jgi:predicted RNA-binding Zn ribbon-like protein
VSWARQAGALDAREARRLAREASRRPRRAAAALRRARSLREALFRTFASAAADRRAPKSAIDSLSPAIAQALGRLRLRPGRRRGARWAWAEDPNLGRMLWPVLRAAGALLTGQELERLRECAAGDCGWLFLDRSKNRSRRWCDMTVCGNRDKARRHRARRRA